MRAKAGGAADTGGLRDSFGEWDFYDVTDDARIDLSDTLEILAKFGLTPGDVGYEYRFDRYAPDELRPWATAYDLSGVGIDLTDALVNLASFGQDCSSPQ